MRIDWKARTAVVLATALGYCGPYTGIAAQAPSAPRYKFDPDWPKPLPNKWKLGGITGLTIDKDDTIWVLTRPNDLRDMELRAELTPPLADCCTRPPAVIHFDAEGNVLGSFDAQEGHGLAVDSKGFIYIGQETVRKYDPRTGKVVAEVPRTPEQPPEGIGATVGGAARLFAAPRVPGRGGPGPTGTGGAGRGRGPDTTAIAAFRAKYPPTTPMIVGGLEDIRIDEAARELYAADGYLGGRVMVFDLDTLAFKRGWGAYGKPLSQVSITDEDRSYTPGGPMPKEFRNHVTLNISNDGLVYAADRGANRIHVTTKDGKFLKEFILAPTTAGSTGGVAFSPDKGQRLLFIPDLNNNHIWFLNRDDGKVIGQMGNMGENGGLFFGLHMLSVDSKGNIYTGEVFNGERLQRFVPSDSAKGKLLEQASRARP